MACSTCKCRCRILFRGPVAFMRTIYHGLRHIGVPEEKINFELFQPGVDIRKAVSEV